MVYPAFKQTNSTPGDSLGTVLVTNALWIKGIVHPKMKIWCFSTYPQGIQDVGEFDSSVEQDF